MNVPCVTRWWWVRHAPVIDSTGHLTNQLYGQRDLSCDTGNDAAFHALARNLPQHALWCITPLRRTGETAQAIHAHMLPPFEPTLCVQADFMEQHFGDWQGLTWSDIEARDTIAHNHFWQDAAHNAPPNGESMMDVIARVGQGIERLSHANAGCDIVVIAHAGTIRAALALALDLPSHTLSAFHIAPLSLTRLDGIDTTEKTKTWRVMGVNMPACAEEYGDAE